jgi:hypothetical protein
MRPHRPRSRSTKKCAWRAGALFSNDDIDDIDDIVANPG